VKNLEGKFVGIGVGPGDPELITVKAVKMLKMADVISFPKTHMDKPSFALSVVNEILKERERPPELLRLVFPMIRDREGLKRAWARNAQIIAEKAKKGKIVAFITLGDPMFYSTFIYLYHSMQKEVKLEIIPGVTSLTACAASSKIPLAEKEEIVAIIPSAIDSNQIEEIARHSSNLILMKGTQRLKDLAPILEKCGFTKNSTIALVRRCTMPEEKVIVGKLRDVPNWDIHDDYFSMIIIKSNENEPWKGEAG
jgi:precorrin-2/cobalt-factor-2 C20-methyltransferase